GRPWLALHAAAHPRAGHPLERPRRAAGARDQLARSAHRARPRRGPAAVRRRGRRRPERVGHAPAGPGRRHRGRGARRHRPHAGARDDGGAGVRAAARRPRRAPRRGGAGGAGGGVRRLLAVLPLVALLLALDARSPEPPAAQPAGELRVALPWTPENLDPTMNLASIRAAVGVSMFDSLVGRDADNRIVPQLAESWRAGGDLPGPVKLRRGGVFHHAAALHARGRRSAPSSGCSPRSRSRRTAPTSPRSAGSTWSTT